LQKSTDLKTWANSGNVRFAAGTTDSIPLEPGYYRVTKLR